MSKRPGDLIRYMNQWAGQPVVIIASGPSVTQEQVDYCKGKARVITINDSHKLAPWADAVYASDSRWWETYYSQVKSRMLNAQLWSMQADDEKLLLSDILFSPVKGEKGLMERPGYINHGTHSGFQAINIAYQFGASKIILLGYDCKYKHHPDCELDDEGKCKIKGLCLRHWFGSHPTGWGDANHIGRWLESYRTINCSRPIINCSPDTAVDAFQKMPLQEALGV